ncbi:hypothetical protein HGA91_05420 [candidate division WWE3 bacterium]|nr:hypothetical protein [candidate division WWE3 bacterium]
MNVDRPIEADAVPVQVAIVQGLTPYDVITILQGTGVPQVNRNCRGVVIGISGNSLLVDLLPTDLDAAEHAAIRISGCNGTLLVPTGERNEGWKLSEAAEGHMAIIALRQLGPAYTPAYLPAATWLAAKLVIIGLELVLPKGVGYPETNTMVIEYVTCVDDNRITTTSGRMLARSNPADRFAITGNVADDD